MKLSTRGGGWEGAVALAEKVGQATAFHQILSQNRENMFQFRQYIQIIRYCTDFVDSIMQAIRLEIQEDSSR